ncbi:hypothetical protein Aspvir_001581 [Aspergillus viridinutans]|uniref:Uncharacterized protein n=1 Tax=Aspergillus viridinutans TaxID=75553 RepID=A0A9P3BMW2_ASPVI|nr:uncharacterized protein Aspvir_001581 [Aspergillus viridinutans]GIJ99449.1 hypothetical protein Aspvir_001581 [Aspergillus viridinutans]
MTQRVARRAMAEAGVTPVEINIYELHHCYSTNKLILLMRLSLRLPEGLRVNPSGARWWSVHQRADGKTDERGFDEGAAKLSGSGPNLALAERYAALRQESASEGGKRGNA